MAMGALHWAGQVPSGNGTEFYRAAGSYAGNNQSYAANQSCTSSSYGGGNGLARTSSAIDMRQLSNALLTAREGTGEVRAILLQASFRPRLPGLTKMVSKLSKEGAWRKALEVYETVEAMGLMPDTALTNSAISACDKGGRWQKALEIFESMDRLGLPRDAITYSATISSLAKGKQWHAALQVFDHMQARDIEADVVTCCSLINALERGGQWQLAEKLFLQMCTVQGEVASPPRQLVLSAGRLVRAQTSPTSVLDILNSAPGAGAMASMSEGLVLGAGLADELAPLGVRKAEGGSGVAKDLSAAFASTLSLSDPAEAPAEAQALGSPPSAALAKSASGVSLLPQDSGVAALQSPGGASLQSPLSAPSLDGRYVPASPPQMHQVHPGRGGPPLSPGVLVRTGSLARREPQGQEQVEAAQHLRRAMSCYPELDGSEQQDQSGLASMFNFTHAVRVAPNRVCCNALLAAYARAKPPQWQKAVHLLASMWGGGPTLAPDSVSYNTAIKACANGFQLARAADLFADMVAHGVKPNVTTFNTMVAAASDSGTGAVLMEVGRWLDAADADVAAACMNAYVAGLVRVGEWDEALLRFQSMLLPNGLVRPTAATFNTMLSGFFKAGQYDRVRGVFNDMLSCGLAPSVVTYNTLLAAQASQGDWCAAIDTLARVLASQADGVNANTTTFNTCLAALACGASSAPASQHVLLAQRGLQVYHSMQAASGCPPDAATYAHLVSLLHSTGHAAQVLALHEVMLSQGHTPDAQTATRVLRSAMQAGQVHKAMVLAHSLQMQGVQLDASLLSCLLDTATGCGAWPLAMQLAEAAQVAQGVAASPAYNKVLAAALAAGQYDVSLELVGAMRTASLPLDPATSAALVAAQVTSSLPADLALPETAALGLDSMAGLPGFSPQRAEGSPRTPPRPTLPELLGGTASPPPPLGSVPSIPEGVVLGQQGLSLAEGNALLAKVKAQSGSGMDVAAALGILGGMNAAGNAPDKETYGHLIELAVGGRQPQLAAQLCSQAHEAGLLQTYTLPALLPAGDVGSEARDAATVDLRGCSLEVGVAAVLTWLTRLAQLRAAGAVIDAPHIKIVAGDLGGPAPEPVVPGEDLLDEVATMMCTGATRVAAFHGLVPGTLPATAVARQEPLLLEVETAAMYDALSTGMRALV